MLKGFTEALENPMLIALMSDIHANREAFEAVLAAVGETPAARIVILGDIVGYGADPGWCLTRVRSLMADGAIAIRGNHDDAAAKSTQSMTTNARIAIEWTREQLDAEARAFLGSLPMQVTDDDRLYVHSEASAPSAWRYVHDPDDAKRHFAVTDAVVSFCGHTHQPALHCISAMGRVTPFTPNAADPIPLLSQRRWLAVLGSVGQPRDGNPASAWALYDTQTRELSFQRTAYDIEKAAAKVRAAGLPEALAARLERGR